jgi:hypothetical protein
MLDEEHMWNCVSCVGVYLAAPESFAFEVARSNDLAKKKNRKSPVIINC